MADKIEYSRMLIKRTDQTGEVPTVPPITATTLNQFIPTDLFVGEFFLNEVDDLLWVRTANGILPISLSGSTGTTTTPTLTQVLFEGNVTNGYDIEVSAGDTIIFQGLNTGSTNNVLGIDASGNTIITSATGEYLPLSGGTITGSTGIFNFEPNVLGGRIEISGNTSLPMYQVSIAPYLTNPTTSVQLGMRTWDSVTNPGYGNVGDAFLYASNETNGLNIINRQTSGSTLDDYIRFYAGQDANGTTPDIHIQGSGSTRGYVGFNKDTPTAQVDINGDLKNRGNVYFTSLVTGDTNTYVGIDELTGQLYKVNNPTTPAGNWITAYDYTMPSGNTSPTLNIDIDKITNGKDLLFNITADTTNWTTNNRNLTILITGTTNYNDNDNLFGAFNVTFSPSGNSRTLTVRVGFQEQVTPLQSINYFAAIENRSNSSAIYGWITPMGFIRNNILYGGYSSASSVTVNPYPFLIT